jgi:hypothetical protein
MTVLAERCLATSQIPTKCALPSSRRAFKAVPYREGRFWSASRWSDDPTRQSTSPGLFKFLVNVGIDNCAGYINDVNDYPGVLCNGHYGTMQFLHSMASVAPGETVDSAAPEPFEETREKVLGWTEFAYGIATDVPLTDPYCASVRKLGAAGTALAPARFPYCGQWSAGSLFGFRCGHPLTSTTCETDIPEGEIRRAAMGALLHMIQDSYSRSHTGRGEDIPLGPYKDPNGRVPAAQVRCQPIQAFYRYTMKQKKAHGVADKAPEFSSDCAGAAVMDPITAGARMIWLVDNKCDASWARNLIAEGVIAGRPAPIPRNAPACQAPVA